MQAMGSPPITIKRMPNREHTTMEKPTIFFAAPPLLRFAVVILCGSIGGLLGMVTREKKRRS